mmetsp:Transcript_38106/g.89091  ORF Transcript_38106/g.89091 Transcript_38106/m.89091 type:complete len:99 (-) Transcript_38106:13-309(-)
MFGAVFSLSDMSLSLGYAIGPVVGTAVQQDFGFLATFLSYAILVVIGGVIVYATFTFAEDDPTLPVPDAPPRAPQPTRVVGQDRDSTFARSSTRDSIQ